MKFVKNNVKKRYNTYKPGITASGFFDIGSANGLGISESIKLLITYLKI